MEFCRLQDPLIWPRLTPLTNLTVHDMRKDQSFAVRLANGSVHVFTFVGIEGSRYLFNHRANSIGRDGRLRKSTTDKQVYFNVPGGISPIVNVGGGRFNLSNAVVKSGSSTSYIPFILEDVIDVKKEVSMVDIEVNNLQTDFNNIYGLFNTMRLVRYTDANLINIENILNDGLGGYIGLESRVNNIPDSVEKDNLKKYIQNIRVYIDVLRRFITVRSLPTLTPIPVPIGAPRVTPPGYLLANITNIRNILNTINSFSIPTLVPLRLPTGYNDIATVFDRDMTLINRNIAGKRFIVNKYLKIIFGSGFTDINIKDYSINHINDMPDAGNTPIPPKMVGAAGGSVPPLNVNKGGATVDIHNDVNILLGLGYNFDEIATTLNNTGYTLPPAPPAPPATSPTPITAADIQRWYTS